MKTFRPGEVARAEDVNANFAELKRETTAHTHALKTTSWQYLTLSRGWDATPGHTPRARWINGIVQIEGAATRRSGGAPADIARLPSDMTPTKTQFIGATTMVKSGTTTRAHAELIADQRGVLNVGDYTNIDGGVNWIIPLGAVFIPA